MAEFDILLKIFFIYLYVHTWQGFELWFIIFIIRFATVIQSGVLHSSPVNIEIRELTKV